MKRMLAFILSASMSMSAFASVPAFAYDDSSGYIQTLAEEITCKAGIGCETAYVEWLPVEGAAKYAVFIKESADSDYPQNPLDDELIRQYKSYWRADALGLSASKTYKMKVAAYDSSGALLSEFETGDLNVKAYDRSGFAFAQGSIAGSNGGAFGGYNADGTPKENAVILYVTNENKDTIKHTVKTGSDTEAEKEGIRNIISWLGYGYDERPYIIRFIGEIDNPNSKTKRYMDVEKNMDNLQDSQGGITFEGVGNDAMLLFSLNLNERAKNIEIRNLGFKDFTTDDEDGVSVQGESSNYWIHNNDFFYGGEGTDEDQAKGDGSADVKATPDMGTISYNHFWDTGKCCLCGLNETENFRVSYHHNWFDHSDSRHPRIRTGSVHVYNNYFDGNSKYGIGATSGASVFSENNYFRSCKYPMLISKQGNEGGSNLSGENGGIIKAYNNIMTGEYTYSEGTKQDGTYSNNGDAYTVSSRSTALPDTLVALEGKTSYNNFDTLTDIGVSQSDIDDAKDVPAVVMAKAGRIDGGDINFVFDDSVEDTNSKKITELDSLLDNYSSGIVSIGGDVVEGTIEKDAPSATGVDGDTSYAEKAQANASEAAELPFQTDSSGNKASNDGYAEDVVSYDFDVELKAEDLELQTLSASLENIGTNGQFAIMASSDSTVTIDSNSAGNRIKLSGKGSADARSIRFTTEKTGKLRVSAVSASSSDTNRNVVVADSEGNIIGEDIVGSNAEFTISSAGTYYIYSTSGAINVTYVGFAEDPEDNPVTEPYELGDVNNDGAIDMEDANICIKYVADNTSLSDSSAIEAMKVMNGQTVTLGDALCIMEKSLNPDGFNFPVLENAE